ncbi:MAG: AMP-binding protein [Gammaproteobacteria bacterium]|nr:AMP-binding protein [Gammaproteobacteria bacterium]
MSSGDASVPATTLRELIDLRADQNGDDVFLIDPVTARKHTFASARDSAQRIARYLRQQGVQPGQSVAFAMSNGIDCALCLLGILYGGYRTTAINLVAGTQTIGYVLEHSETTVVLTQNQHLQLLHEAQTDNTGTTMVEVNAEWWDTLPEAQPASDDLGGDADGLLMYTSGTTGRPKGVVLTHKNLLAAGQYPTLAHALTAADRALCVLPLYHINGFCTTVMAPLYSGSSVVMPERYSTGRFWDWIRQNQCTWFSVVPTHISYLLHQAIENRGSDKQHDHRGLEQVRFGRSASAPLAPDTQRGFEEEIGIPIVETMGLTETGGQILSNPLPPGVRKIGSPGVAVGDEVMIADTNLQPVPPATEGEILIRGDNVMNRYLKNPEATADALTQEGWLRTGDLGRMDAEGYVFVTGRLKELIIKGGENIAPREVDEALYHHPDVVEAAAFACDCDQYGQRVEAAVALSVDSAVAEHDLVQLCTKLLGNFKSPDRVYILDELPKGPSGKIQRRKLVDMFAH